MARGWRARLATLLRRLADRLDDHGAPRCMGWSFEFVRNVGIEFNDEGHGCPVWYYGRDDYERAYERGRG